MNNKWRKEIRGHFGWYVEGKRDIKAFWLPKVTFQDPACKVNGTISTVTADLLRQNVGQHSSEFTVSSDFEPALSAGDFIKAFGVSDSLGGGFMVVLPASIMEFHTLAFERAPKKAWQFWRR